MSENEYVIDFYKYLNCPECKDAGLYCKIHRTEVEKILDQKLKEKHA